MTPRSPFQRFMAELRRRHVPQTLAVYAVAAWAAIEFADVVVPNLGWPQGVVTAVIIAAGVGFPVVIALAWFLEWTPEGLHRTEAAPEERPEGERGRPVEPAPSFGPWAAALGVLALGIAGALVYVALQDDRVETAVEEPRTRSERRQMARDSMLLPPVPPFIARPGFADSLARSASDSVLRALESERVGELELGPLIEMATRIGESAGRFAAGGPVEIVEPETWRYGAPQPVHPGDTIHVRGVARSPSGVLAVELDGRVVARSREGATELPFDAAVVAGQGRGFRQVPLIIQVRDGEPLARNFSYTIVPRDRESSDAGAGP